VDCHKFVRIQKALRVQGEFERRVDGTADFGDGLRPPALFGNPDAVRACDGAAPGENLGKQFGQSRLDLFLHGRILLVVGRHDVDVDIAVAGMPETGDGITRAAAKITGELRQIDEAAPGYDAVFV